MDNELMKVDVKTMTPAMLLQIAVEKGTDLAQLEKLMDLQERWEKKEALKAYISDMAEFKKDLPKIYKDKTNKQFNSKYASIETIVNDAIPKLSEYGLSHRWDYPKGEKDRIYVRCILTHRLGHSEEVIMDCLPDTSGGNSKNPIQQIKSATTYLKIMTFEAVTGIVSEENKNDDGNSVGEQKGLTEEVLS
jgi:hypothetical protein